MGAPLTRNRIFLLLVHKKVAENGIDLKKEAEKMKDDFRMKQTEKWFLGRNTKSNLWSVNSHLLSCGETTWRRQELLLEKEHALVRKTIKKQEERSQKSLNRKHLGFKSYLGTHGPTFDSLNFVNVVKYSNAPCPCRWRWNQLLAVSNESLPQQQRKLHRRERCRPVNSIKSCNFNFVFIGEALDLWTEHLDGDMGTINTSQSIDRMHCTSKSAPFPCITFQPQKDVG